MLLRARIAQLWQTRLLRYSHLSVTTTIENTARILPNDLPAQIPNFMPTRDQLGRYPSRSFFRMDPGSAAIATAIRM